MKQSSKMQYQITNPLVSVIIVNYNGKRFLINCLESVFNSTYSNFEVIVIDNDSSDGSLMEIQAKFKDIRLKNISLDQNYGPAYARNKGIEIATGKYLAFLDNDTEPENTWLDSLVNFMEKDKKVGMCQCKLLLLNDPKRLDYVGDYLSQFGFLVQKATANEIDRGQYDSYDEIFSAKSAAMVVRKDIIDKVGGFDDDYFIYVEETDLCWRGWLAGYKTVFFPESRVRHAFGGSALSLGETQNYFAKFHGSKNYITTLIKNLGFNRLLIMVPVHIILWVCMAFWLILHGQFRDAKNIYKGIFWVVANFKTILKKRKKIQELRVLTDQELFPHIMRKKGLEYFYKKVSTVKKLGFAEGFYRKEG